MSVANNRKHDDDDDERQGQPPRRSKRSHSEPLPRDSDMAEKRTALKRLFGRNCSVEPDNQQRVSDDDFDDPNAPDENEDPYLDSVPVNLDPEQLGFTVCAHLTLAFLESRGMPLSLPMFARLRRRLRRGIRELGLA